MRLVVGSDKFQSVILIFVLRNVILKKKLKTFDNIKIYSKFC